MSKKFGFLKSSLLGSSTMPLGTGGAFSLLTPVHAHTHEHAADGLVAVMTTVTTIIMSMELIATMSMYMTSIAVIIISNLL